MKTMNMMAGQVAASLLVTLSLPGIANEIGSIELRKDSNPDTPSKFELACSFRLVCALDAHYTIESSGNIKNFSHEKVFEIWLRDSYLIKDAGFPFSTSYDYPLTDTICHDDGKLYRGTALYAGYLSSVGFPSHQITYESDSGVLRGVEVLSGSSTTLFYAQCRPR